MFCFCVRKQDTQFFCAVEVVHINQRHLVLPALYGLLYFHTFEGPVPISVTPLHVAYFVYFVFFGDQI